MRPGQPPCFERYSSPGAHLSQAVLVVAKLGLTRAWPLSNQRGQQQASPVSKGGRAHGIMASQPIQCLARWKDVPGSRQEPFLGTQTLLFNTFLKENMGPYTHALPHS